MGVVLGFDVVVRAVLHDVVEVVLVLGVAPFVKFKRRQRNALVEHGVDDIDEGHASHDAVEQSRREVHHGTHQQAARAAAHGVHVVRACESGVHHGLATVDEVGEGVHFVEQLAVLVPLTSHLAASADVGDGVHKPAVEQAQARHREAGVHAVAVAAVGVEEEGVVSRALEAFAVDDAHRHFDPVAGLHHHAFADVVGRVKLAAQHFLLLEGFDVACGEGVFQHAVGRGHGRVAVAQAVRVEVGVGADVRGVRRIVEGDVDVGSAIPTLDADAVEPFLAFLHHEVLVEDVDAFEQHVVAVREHVFPVVVGRRVDRGLHELEVLGVAVGDDVEVVAIVADAVFQIALALLHHLPFAVGGVGVEVPPLGAHRGARADHEVFLGFGLANAARERLVFLFKHQHVLAHGRAQHVLVDLERTQGHGVLLGVEQRLVVVGPCGASSGFWNAVLEELSGAEVFDKEGVLSAADGVHAVHEQVVVGADAASTHCEVAVSLGQRGLVEHDLFFRVHGAFLAAGEGVLLALFVAAVVPVAFVQHGHAFVVFFDAAHNLVVELGLQRLRGGHDVLLVGVFSLEVGHHFCGLGVGLLGFFLLVAQPHPEVVVLQLQSVDVGDVRLLGRIRRRGEFRSLGHVVGGLHVLRRGVAAEGKGPNRHSGRTKKSHVHFNEFRAHTRRAGMRRYGTPCCLKVDVWTTLEGKKPFKPTP